MFYIFVGLLLGILIYYKIIKHANYWNERNVNCEPSWPIIGNMGNTVFRNKHWMDIVIEIYKRHARQRYVGYMQFTKPILMLRDLELIKQVGTNELDCFHNYQIGKLQKDPLFSKSLISLTGENWRQMRATFSPAFTSDKMKNMYHLITECAENFVGSFKGKEQVAVEIKDIFSRFTTDVIATIAFGIKINSLENPNNIFFNMVKRFGKFSPAHTVKLLFMSLSSSLSDILGIELFPKDVTNYMRTIIKDTIIKRERENLFRPDLIHFLMEASKGRLSHEFTEESEAESHVGRTTKQMQLTDDHIAAQTMHFFFAGVETVSTASSFMAYELALHPDIQKKVQNEIDAIARINNHEEISYEALLSMRYLDQVVSESLRKWPPGLQIDRLCAKNFTIHLNNSNEKEVIIDKGTSVLIPIIALHRDAQYFPEPERFDPERFNEKNIVNIVPGSYLPFGIGPRNCIGSRLALLEIKVLFFHLLSKFDIVALTGTQIPIKISPKKKNLLPVNGFRLGLKPRKKN